MEFVQAEIVGAWTGETSLKVLLLMAQHITLHVVCAREAQPHRSHQLALAPCLRTYGGMLSPYRLRTLGQACPHHYQVDSCNEIALLVRVGDRQHMQ